MTDESTILEARQRVDALECLLDYDKQEHDALSLKIARLARELSEARLRLDNMERKHG